MALMLKRQLNDDEKARVLKQHGRKCFATGHTIPEGEALQFDHIKAFALSGQSEIDNIAPMCAQHNKEKGALPLYDFRTKLRLGDFFETGDKLTLKHLLEYLLGQKEITAFGQPISVREDGESVVIESATKEHTHNVYVCPITGWKYFYATLGVNLIDSDDEQDDTIGLQPRYLIFDKVFELFRHFQRHPVLQPSIGRIVSNRIRLFDGQHKVAALLWNEKRTFECKIYLSPDVRLLNQTNIAAHDKFAQTRFYSSIMVLKLGGQFGADFEAYKNLEDGHVKSEYGFMEYLRQKDGGTLTKGQLNERFRSYLYNAILQMEDNKLAHFVSSGNRSTDEKPITIDMLSKSIFSGFLFREPVDDNMTTDAYKRDSEVQNMVRLMNMFYDLALCEWNGKAGPNSDTQRKLERLFRSKSMMAWSELLKDAICAKLELHDSDEKNRPLYRDFAETEIVRMRDVVTRLVSWKQWAAPENDDLDRILADNKSEVKNWFREKGLTTGYLMGAPE